MSTKKECFYFKNINFCSAVLHVQGVNNSALSEISRRSCNYVYGYVTIDRLQTYFCTAQ